jgi:hypothetical protein
MHVHVPGFNADVGAPAASKPPLQQPDHAHQQPEQELAVEGSAAAPAGPLSLAARLTARGMSHARALQAGLQNKGPIKLKPTPGSWEEAVARCADGG